MPSKGWKVGMPTIQIKRNCYFCGQEFRVWPSTLKHHKDQKRMACSRQCRKEHLSRWIDDKRYKASHGYIMIMKEGVKKSCKLSDMVYEHRVVAEQYLGRKLKSNEEVHHLNGDRADNRPENLMVSNNSKHKQLLKALSIVVCEKCGHENVVSPLDGILLTS